MFGQHKKLMLTLVSQSGPMGQRRLTKLCILIFSSRLTSSLTYPRNYKYFTPGIRVVHLDLKGAAPKLSFLRELFALVRKLEPF